MLKHSSDDINEFMEGVVGFIWKLMDDAVHKPIIRTFPNQKLWVDKTIHDALRQLTAAYNMWLQCVQNGERGKAMLQEETSHSSNSVAFCDSSCCLFFFCTIFKIATIEDTLSLPTGVQQLCQCFHSTGTTHFAGIWSSSSLFAVLCVCPNTCQYTLLILASKTTVCAEILIPKFCIMTYTITDTFETMQKTKLCHTFSDLR